MKKKAKTMLSMLLVAIMTVTLAPQSLLQTVGVKTEAEASTTLSNPRIVEDSSMKAGQKVTWDCVWFGSYPQTEIVDQANTCGCYGRSWITDSDYEIDADLYTELQNSSYDSNGDTTIGNTKYHRINVGDSWNARYNDEWYYSWKNSGYHYFRYDPIKWRVLNVSNGKAFLLADVALDDHPYNTPYTGVTWEISTIRSWLNGYGSSSNISGYDYTDTNFIDRAFNSYEQNAVAITQLVNADNIKWGAEGGNDTNDKIFFLSESDTSTINSYGFVTDNDIFDEAKRCQTSTFAKARGALADPTDQYQGYLGNCLWWLRSPALFGNYSEAVMVVKNSGTVCNGLASNDNTISVRPALNLNLSSSNRYSYAGTVCSDGTIKEVDAPFHVHSWVTGVVTKQPTTSEEGEKIYTCTICGTTKTELIAKLPSQQDSQTTQATQPTQSTQATVVVPGTTLTSVKNVKTRKLNIKWLKNTAVNGYVIQMSTNKAFTSGVIQKMVYNNQTVSIKSQKLKKKKTYYVRVCTYMVVNGQIYYSNWSNVKKVKIKK